MKRAEPREDVLIVATKPCWVCVEEAERRGVDALRLCNRKRRRAFAEHQRMQRALIERLDGEDAK